MVLPCDGYVACGRHEMAALVCLHMNGGHQFTGVGQGKKQLLFASLLQVMDDCKVARWGKHRLLHLLNQVF
jgi:hypothetical protein